MLEPTVGVGFIDIEIYDLVTREGQTAVPVDWRVRELGRLRLSEAIDVAPAEVPADRLRLFQTSETEYLIHWGRLIHRMNPHHVSY
jgi:hypothetical protein